MQLPAMGYGLRYEYGMFKQAIRDGWQRNSRTIGSSAGPLGGRTPPRDGGGPAQLLVRTAWRNIARDYRPALPLDRPSLRSAGRRYGGKTINTLRLWAAAAPDYFDFQAFSNGEFVGAVADARGRIAHEGALSRRLDEHRPGPAIRPGVFSRACSLADLVRRFRRGNADWSLPEKVAIQLNDRIRAWRCRS